MNVMYSIFLTFFSIYLVSISSISFPLQHRKLQLSTFAHVTVILPADGNIQSYFLNKPTYLAPLKNTSVSWLDVFHHEAEKLDWENIKAEHEQQLQQQSIAKASATSKPKPKLAPDELLTMNIVCVNDINLYPSTINSIVSPVCMLVGFKDECSINDSFSNTLNIDGFKEILKDIPTVLTFDCSKSFTSFRKYDGISDFELQQHKSLTKNAIANCYMHWMEPFEWERRNAIVNIITLVDDLWTRKSSDDILFLLLTLIDTFTSRHVKSVQAVTSPANTGWKELKCMVSNCGSEIFECLKDEKCRKAVSCLSKCRGNDQVCSYRCIVSHESPAFEKFAYCILQKHNCMHYSASIPSHPSPEPLTHFRGSGNPLPVTFEVAEDIFIGHLRPRPGEENHLLHEDLQRWSWKVVAGQNPAYDYFSCQHQLYYRDAKNKKQLWYDPVFKVTTLYGEEVWRRRHYKTRRGKKPGEFYFNVLDNGVTSNEFWRILDCDDNLEWAVFYYSGAASAAGTSYTGALVVSKDGTWPDMTTGDAGTRIQAALDRAGIKMWELFQVSNADCEDSCAAGPPPLEIE